MGQSFVEQRIIVYGNILKVCFKYGNVLQVTLFWKSPSIRTCLRAKLCSTHTHTQSQPDLTYERINTKHQLSPQKWCKREHIQDIIYYTYTHTNARPRDSRLYATHQNDPIKMWNVSINQYTRKAPINFFMATTTAAVIVVVVVEVVCPSHKVGVRQGEREIERKRCYAHVCCARNARQLAAQPRVHALRYIDF